MTPAQSVTTFFVALSILGLLAATIVLFLFASRRGYIEPVKEDDGEYDDGR